MLALRKVNLGITEFTSMTLHSVCCYSETSEENVAKNRGKHLNVIAVTIITAGSMSSVVFYFGYDILLKMLLIHIKYTIGIVRL